VVVQIQQCVQTCSVKTNEVQQLVGNELNHFQVSSLGKHISYLKWLRVPLLLLPMRVTRW